VEDLTRAGYFPMKLTLLREGISLEDQEKLGEETCWMYYYYIMAERKIEREELEKLKEESGSTGKTSKKMEFPMDFVSELKHKIAEEEVNKI